MNVYQYIKQAWNILFSLKTSIKTVFPFGKYDLGENILGLIAKKEGLVEYQIVNHLARGTRRKVSNTINNFLIPYGFLYEEQSTKSRRNVKNAFGKGKEIKPRKYFLTFKGFLVSLTSVKLKDHLIIKKYLEFFPEKSKEDVLQYLKNNILEYVYYNHAIGLELNNVKDLVFHIDDTSPRWDVMDIGEGVKEELKELESKQSQLSEKLFKDNENLFYLLEYWAKALDSLTKKIDKEELLNKLEKESFYNQMKESGFYEKLGLNDTILRKPIREINNLSLADMFKDL